LPRTAAEASLPRDEPGPSWPVARGLLLGLVWLAAGVAAPPSQAQPVRILAAFTLKPALDQIIAGHRGGEVQPVYGPSPTLAKKIENGLPADLFFPPIRYGWTNSRGTA
jgi:ABC-type molybdate transport system substrate-binding protein